MERPGSDVADLETGDGLDWAVGAALDDVHRLFTRLFDRRMAKLGLTRAQWRVLTFLFRRDGMTQSALADLLEMERAPLGRLLDRLEESGWVERRADPGDKRAKRVFRTGKIDPLLPTVKTDAHDVLSGALSGLGDGERRAVLAALARMKANLQTMEQAGPAPEDSPDAPVNRTIAGIGGS
ncbi:MAG: MarR family winged helix-turn-helix transcriptional regulator [Alphaproteobacteria bacterium]